MKHNYFAYSMYVLYIVLFFFLGKFLLFSPDRGLLLMVMIWFLPPVLLAFIPNVLIKKILMKRLAPQIKHSFYLSLITTIQTIGLAFIYSFILTMLASLVRMDAGDLPTLELWGISQTFKVLAIEVLSLSGLFAWVTRILEYHLIWHYIDQQFHLHIKRILLYANMVNYIFITVFFVIWQLMIFYQIPECLWHYL